MFTVLAADAAGTATGIQESVLDAIRNSLTQSEQRDLSAIILNLALAAGLSWLLGVLYVKCGRAMSNRRAFAANFVLVTIATMVIITIVKSSLALSLGLVGALSIVRYRTAIKEPEELSFLLLAITIGLGFGAQQPKTTIVSFAVIAAIILLRHIFLAKKENQHLNLIVTAGQSLGLSVESICGVVQKHCSQLHMRRFDQNSENLEITFLVGIRSFSDFEACRRGLTDLHSEIGISYLDPQSYL